MGHIRLSRENDLIVVVPASANIISSMVVGRADDLATAVLLASNKPVMIAPAMNTQMWHHPATQRNIKQLKADGVEVIEPASGMLACGEEGQGRLADVDTVVTAILARLKGAAPLRGIKALITSGPTYEPIDPVRFIGNRSSGKQGHAIAAALVRAGAEVTLVSGPVAESDPEGVKVVHVETAEQMLAACKKALPADVAICAAAVADWRAKTQFPHKIKKRANASPPDIALTQNPDILKTISAPGKTRPALVIGFAAETEQVKKYATEKRLAKGCDWIVANDVSGGKVFGADFITAHLITPQGTENFEAVSKQVFATGLTERIIHFFSKEGSYGKRERSKTPTRR
jgi:phosphopantothenoylcysteine decarboxylase/phosphopantothenate--cysteine ligase